MVVHNEGVEFFSSNAGFTRIKPGESIKASLRSVQVFSVQGIKIDDLGSPLVDNLISRDDWEVTFAFGNSQEEISRYILGFDLVEYNMDRQKHIVEVARAMLGLDCVQELSTLKREENGQQLFFIVHVSNKNLSECTSGFYRTFNDKVITLHSFNDAIKSLLEAEKALVSALISSLIIQFSRLRFSIKFKPVMHFVYGKTDKGHLLQNITIHPSSEVSTLAHVSANDVKERIPDVKKQCSGFNSRVAVLFYSALNEKDRLKKFLYLFLSCELYINSIFSKDEMSSYLPIREEKRNDVALADKFEACAKAKNWTSLDGNGICESFRRIKGRRDKLLHGKAVVDSELPVEELEALLHNILIPG